MVRYVQNIIIVSIILATMYTMVYQVSAESLTVGRDNSLIPRVVVGITPQDNSTSSSGGNSSVNETDPRWSRNLTNMLNTIPTNNFLKGIYGNGSFIHKQVNFSELTGRLNADCLVKGESVVGLSINGSVLNISCVPQSSYNISYNRLLNFACPVGSFINGTNGTGTITCAEDSLGNGTFTNPYPEELTIAYGDLNEGAGINITNTDGGGGKWSWRAFATGTVQNKGDLRLVDGNLGKTFIKIISQQTLGWIAIQNNTNISENLYVSKEGFINGSEICTSANGECGSGSGISSTVANMTYLKQVNVTRNVNITAGMASQIGNWTISNGAHQIQVYLAISSLGISQTKYYIVEVGYNTPSVWNKVIPLATSGAYTPSPPYEDVDMDVISNGDTMQLRVRRVSGINPANVNIVMINSGLSTDSFTPENRNSSVTAPTVYLKPQIEKIAIAPVLGNNENTLLGNYLPQYIESPEVIYLENESTDSGGTIQSPITLVSWVREGRDSIAYTSAADWQISRWIASSVESRTQINLRLAHGQPVELNPPTIMTWRSDGNVSVSGDFFVNKRIYSANSTNYTGQVVCYATGGELGHCTSTVGLGGGCTCARN